MPIRIHRITGVKLFFIPVKTRVPLKFGLETLTSVTCLRVALRVVDERNHPAEGWGETPLSVQWVWPSALPYERRHEVLRRFSLRLADVWMRAEIRGHPLEAGYDFQEQSLRNCFAEFNQKEACFNAPNSIQPNPGEQAEPMPWLAALVCNSPFDIALHDAFGHLANRPVYETYGPDFLEHDLTHFLEPAKDASVTFSGKHPADFLLKNPPQQLLAWHLVAGLDPLEPGDSSVALPHDGYPVRLSDWIQKDGLKCLKIKLRGTDEAWDYERLVTVAKLALPLKVEWFTADFNCTVQQPDYVNAVLDRLARDLPTIYDRLLYVEQPFPYELEQHRLDVHSVSARKPLFLDESAHDWRMIRLGRELGWTGVALKTCKTQTGAILSACWARAHGMDLMVQDLTNPMLAQITHVLLASRVGTIMGVETNSMQFYPDASGPEAKVHPGLYQRRNGVVDLFSISGSGFGYRLGEIERALPEPALLL
jgi:L-alanine-DL-glutamate epimerase-like enolase superfamily enzyme